MEVKELRNCKILILSPARLPVPPLRHVLRRLDAFWRRVQTRLNVSLVNSAGQAARQFPRKSAADFPIYASPYFTLLCYIVRHRSFATMWIALSCIINREGYQEEKSCPRDPFLNSLLS
jgi:hypothetical protein